LHVTVGIKLFLKFTQIVNRRAGVTRKTRKERELKL
jgi:hypothetical protein